MLEQIGGFGVLLIIGVVLAVARLALKVMETREPDTDSVEVLRGRQGKVEEASRYRNKVMRDRAIWKMMKTVELCRANLNAAKLAPGQDRYIHFYLGYLMGMAEAISLADGVEFDRTLRLPIYLEAGKLLGDGNGEIETGAELFAGLSGKADFEKGRRAGALDGEEASLGVTEEYWFHRIDRYFRRDP